MVGWVLRLGSEGWCVGERCALRVAVAVWRLGLRVDYWRCRLLFSYVAVNSERGGEPGRRRENFLSCEKHAVSADRTLITTMGAAWGLARGSREISGSARAGSVRETEERLKKGRRTESI